MWQSFARMMLFTLIVLLVVMAGCISDKANRSTRDSTRASEPSNAVSSGSCH